MRIRSITAAGATSLAAALLLTAPPARAGCPSASSGGCYLPVNVAATFDPDPGCLTTRQEPNDCVCAVDIWVRNDCGEDVLAVDFAWTAIDPYPWSDEDPVVTLPAGSEGRLGIRATEGETEGVYQQTFQLDVAGEATTLTVDYGLEHYESGAGCSIAPRSSASWLPLALPLPLLLLMRRRSGRRTRR